MSVQSSAKSSSQQKIKKARLSLFDRISDSHRPQNQKDVEITCKELTINQRTQQQTSSIGHQSSSIPVPPVIQPTTFLQHQLILRLKIDEVKKS